MCTYMIILGLVFIYTSIIPTLGFCVYKIIKAIKGN